MKRKSLMLCALATVVGSEVATASVVLAQKSADTTFSGFRQIKILNFCQWKT